MYFALDIIIPFKSIFLSLDQIWLFARLEQCSLVVPSSMISFGYLFLKKVFNESVMIVVALSNFQVGNFQFLVTAGKSTYAMMKMWIESASSLIRFVISIFVCKVLSSILISRLVMSIVAFDYQKNKELDVLLLDLFVYNIYSLDILMKKHELAMARLCLEQGCKGRQDWRLGPDNSNPKSNLYFDSDSVLHVLSRKPSVIGLILPPIAKLRTMVVFYSMIAFAETYVPNKLRRGKSLGPANIAILFVLLMIRNCRDDICVLLPLGGYYRRIENSVIITFPAIGLFTSTGSVYALKRWEKHPYRSDKSSKVIFYISIFGLKSGFETI
uniref:Uncharacterized protein n=1 Tax=Cucumis melo TaxID=3656 RepID=A0A9I9EGH4_CUCME